MLTSLLAPRLLSHRVLADLILHGCATRWLHEKHGANLCDNLGKRCASAPASDRVSLELEVLFVNVVELHELVRLHLAIKVDAGRGDWIILRQDNLEWMTR